VARLTDIAAELKTLITAIRKLDINDDPTGYNFDWLAANEFDVSLQQSWPHPIIRYKTEQTSGSKQLDLYGMANAEFTIEIEPNLTTPNETNPILAADAYYDQAIADLRKLFFGNLGYLALSGEAVITYISKSVEDHPSGDTTRPGKLTTRWNVFYHVS
jgi:hypothetical protein